MRTLRASYLPQLMACPGSGVAPIVVLPRDETAADVGTDAHGVLARVVTGERVELDDIESVDVRILVAQGIKLWRQVQPSFPAPAVEQEFRRTLCEGVELTGHTDIVSAYLGSDNTSTVHVGDFKTGRLDSDYSHQLRAYGWLASEGVDRIIGTVLWVREGEVESSTWTPRYLDSWAEEVVERIVGWDGRTLYPGPHCTYCRRAHECDARTAMVRANVRVLVDTSPDALDAMTPEQIVGLVAKAREVSKAADSVLAAIRERVITSGDIVSADGKLTTEASVRRTIDTEKAWPVLESALDVADPERFFRAVSVSWKDASDLAASLAARGQKKSAIEDLEARLIAAGALKATTSHKLVTRRS